MELQAPHRRLTTQCGSQDDDVRRDEEKHHEDKSGARPWPAVQPHDTRHAITGAGVGSGA